MLAALIALGLAAGAAPAAPPPPTDPITIEALFADLDDGMQEEPWEGDDVERLEVPEIPPLDLDWGPDLDDDDLR